MFLRKLQFAARYQYISIMLFKDDFKITKKTTPHFLLLKSYF